jgi:hypothetical protein
LPLSAQIKAAEIAENSTIGVEFNERAVGYASSLRNREQCCGFEESVLGELCEPLALSAVKPFLCG